MALRKNRLVSVGTVVQPSSLNSSKSSSAAFFPTEERLFWTKRGIQNHIECSKHLGILISEGRSEGNTRYVHLNPCLFDDMLWDFSIHPEHIHRFGQPNVFVFDWSGVVSDDRRPVYEANMRMLQTLGGFSRLSYEEWSQRPGSSAYESLKGIVGESLSRTLVDSVYPSIYAQVREEGMHPEMYPGADKVLANLKKNGKKIAVVSKHPHEHLVREAREYGLEGYIDFIDGDSADKTKSLLSLSEFFGDLPENMIYFGDMTYDIAAAKYAGVHSAAVPTGYHSREQLVKANPEFVLDSLTDAMYIRGVNGGGVELVYPVDRPGLLGGLSPRDAMTFDIEQRDLSRARITTAHSDSRATQNIDIINA
jgi:phosphoglycolate phosphatase